MMADKFVMLWLWLLLQSLHGLECSRQQIRDSWATWNPQRAATQQLQEAIMAGTLTLQVRCWCSWPTRLQAATVMLAP